MCKIKGLKVDHSACKGRLDRKTVKYCHIFLNICALSNVEGEILRCILLFLFFVMNSFHF